MVQMRTAAIARACRAPDDDLGLFTSESIAAERIFAWKSPELKTPSLVELARALLYGIPLGSRVMDGLRSNKDGVECLREEASDVEFRTYQQKYRDQCYGSGDGQPGDVHHCKGRRLPGTAQVQPVEPRSFKRDEKPEALLDAANPAQHRGTIPGNVPSCMRQLSNFQKPFAPPLAREVNIFYYVVLSRSPVYHYEGWHPERKFEDMSLAELHNEIPYGDGTRKFIFILTGAGLNTRETIEYDDEISFRNLREGISKEIYAAMVNVRTATTVLTFELEIELLKDPDADPVVDYTSVSFF